MKFQIKLTKSCLYLLNEKIKLDKTLTQGLEIIYFCTVLKPELSKDSILEITQNDKNSNMEIFYKNNVIISYVIHDEKNNIIGSYYKNKKQNS